MTPEQKQKVIPYRNAFIAECLNKQIATPKQLELDKRGEHFKAEQIATMFAGYMIRVAQEANS